MKSTKLYKVKLKSSGKIMLVYKLLIGGYCDSIDHKTAYAEQNLEFLDKDENTNEHGKSNKVFRFKNYEDN